MPVDNPQLEDVYVAFQVIPRLKEGNNFEVVDKAIAVVKAADVPYQVGAMETTMKGNLNVLLEIVKDAQQACYDAGALEVITNIKIHSKTQAATETFCTYDRGVTKANHMFVDK
ncbi:thiamine-binding protein [Alginatibacterium sediminis]|uniref:Thiamine-binding protein n=1 Tax=Alginatibacterium sediminis TaxID=2164068 RepID=A0A420E9D0_9ALTE|nr:thiamine-binding protein [Alginatibacterium sediminis]RKF15692.1 thiamine-binding protein [Alginatibacterium sediminis]